MRIVRFVLGALLLASVWACNKTEHWLRIKNERDSTVNITIGSTQYLKVKSKEVTNYKLIDGGAMPIKGYKDTMININGEGQHYWSYTLKLGNSTIVEDL